MATKKEVISWDDDLAKQALQAAKTEDSAGEMSFFSTQGGALRFQDMVVPGNQMAVVILDSIFANSYYKGTYDTDNPQPPTCFALAREEVDLEPHIIVKTAGQAQSVEGCKLCENNAFGSADTGRGKACKTARRLALVGAGSFSEKGDFTASSSYHLENSPIGYFTLPVTSVKGYSMFVRQVASMLRRPLYGILTRIWLTPHPKNQITVNFEVISNVSNDLMPLVMGRRASVSDEIETPYRLTEMCDESTSRSRKY